MSDRHAIPVPDLRVLAPDRGRMGAVLILAALMIGAAWLPDLPDLARRGLIAAGLSVIIVAGGMVVNRRMQERARTTARQLLAGIIERDAAPGVVTDGDGLVHARNAAARARFGATGGETLAALLRGLLANPSALLLRLQSRARIEGAAQEDVAIRGGRLRLAVHRLGENGFLWRMEELAQRAGAPGQVHRERAQVVRLGVEVPEPAGVGLDVLDAEVVLVACAGAGRAGRQGSEEEDGVGRAQRGRCAPRDAAAGLGEPEAVGVVLGGGPGLAGAVEVAHGVVTASADTSASKAMEAAPTSTLLRTTNLRSW